MLDLLQSFLAHLAMPKMNKYDNDLSLLLLSSLASASMSVDSLPAIFKMAALFKNTTVSIWRQLVENTFNLSDFLCATLISKWLPVQL